MPQHHGRRSSTQLTLQAAFSQTAFQVLPTATGPIDVVDLFCGVGGFSEGARQAGHRVVLAVDSNKSALDAHKLNHPSAVHELAILPTENLQQLLPSAGTKWHLHGSPPCTKLSRAGGTNRSAADRAEGLFLVNWFLDLVAEVGCTTWSMEQVAQEDVLEELAARQKAAPQHIRVPRGEHGTLRSATGAEASDRRISSTSLSHAGASGSSACSKGHGCHPSSPGPCGGHQRPQGYTWSGNGTKSTRRLSKRLLTRSLWSYG